MSAKKVLLTVSLLPLLAIAGVSLVAFPFHVKSKDDETLSANIVCCQRARTCLREADQRFADAVAGLRRVSVAKERLVLGDRRLASRYVQQITEIRERLHQLSEETDRTFGGAVLPEINPIDED
jgi:hypothetical protein